MTKLNYLYDRGLAATLLLFGRTAQAQSVFDRMISRHPEQRYPLASRAHLNAQAGQLQAALADHAELLRRWPLDAAGWFNQGYVFELAGQWASAADSFTRATELDPQIDRAWYGLGLVLIRLQRYDEAVVALQRNTKLQPMSPYGWYQLARVYVDKKQPDEAVKIIRHLRGFEPKVAAQLERETGLLAPSRG